MTTNINQTLTLQKLRVSVKRLVFVLGSPPTKAIQAVVDNVPDDMLGTLLLEADGDIHPAAIDRSAFKLQPSFSLIMREMLKGILDMQLQAEVMRESSRS